MDGGKVNVWKLDHIVPASDVDVEEQRLAEVLAKAGYDVGKLSLNALTDSRRHFSSAWLCRANNYLCLRAGREASADALVELFQTLWREGRIMLAARVAWAVLWLPEGARR